MTEADIECLKRNTGREVQIVTTEGEHLIAKVLFVTHDQDYDEHDLIYEVVSSNMLYSYANLDKTGGYVLGFENIVSVKPHSL